MAKYKPTMQRQLNDALEYGKLQSSEVERVRDVITDKNLYIATLEKRAYELLIANKELTDANTDLIKRLPDKLAVEDGKLREKALRADLEGTSTRVLALEFELQNIKAQRENLINANGQHMQNADEWKRRFDKLIEILCK